MSVREDGISLFGFLSREDLEIYRMLIGVSGIGPKRRLRCCPRLLQTICALPSSRKMSRRLPKHRHRKEDRAEADSGIKRQIRPAGSVRAEAGRKSGGCGNTAGRRTGCLPGCGTGADCAWLLRNGSTAGSKESRNHRRHGQRGCAESGIEAYVLADGPKLWKKETL